MRVLTINELMRLTRIELCALAARITNASCRHSRKARPTAPTRIHQPAQHPLGSWRGATSRPSRAKPLPDTGRGRDGPICFMRASAANSAS